MQTAQQGLAVDLTPASCADGTPVLSDSACVAGPGGFPIALRPGRYCITEARDAAARAAAEAPAGDGREAHPIFAFIIALNGLGESVADVYARVGATLDDGPVLATCRIDYAQPMRVGEYYRVSGDILSLVQKPSRRFGQARHMTQRIAIADAHGAPAATVELTAVIPVAGTAA